MSTPTINQVTFTLVSATGLAHLLETPPSHFLRGVELAAFLSLAASIYKGVTRNDLKRPHLTRQNLNRAILSAIGASTLIASGAIKAPAKIKNLARMIVGLTIAAALWRYKKNNASGSKPDRKALQKRFLDTLPQHAPSANLGIAPSELAVKIETQLATISETIFGLPTQFYSLQEYVEAGADIELSEGALAAIQSDIPENRDPQTVQLRNSLDALIASLSQLKEERQQNLVEYIRTNYRAVEMGGDGDCFFRSVIGSCGLSREDADKQHLDLRGALVRLMGNNRAVYEPLIQQRLRGETKGFQKAVEKCPGEDLFEKYLHYMSQLGSYAGTPEAQAASDFLGRPIVFLQWISKKIQTPNTVFPKTQTQNPNPIAILNLRDGHFRSLLLLG